jgi:hypothetical protein
MRYLRPRLLALGLVVLLGSCRKSGPVTDYGTSSLLFVNSSVHAPSIDIYGNGALLYNQLAFPDSTGYLTTTTQVNRLALLFTGDTILDVPTVFVPRREYSVFVVDSAFGNGVALAVVPDSIPPARPGYAMVRFLNFSPSVPSLDLYATTTGQYLFTDRYFNETDVFATSFVSVLSGTYSLELRAPGTIVSVASLGGLTLQAGKVYTLFAKGVVGIVGSRTLGIGVLRHN